MKSLFAILAAMTVMTVSAQSATVYSFTKAEDGKGWILDGDPGFKPAPRFFYDAAEKAWRAEKAGGKNGFLFKNKVRRLSVKDGDVLTITIEAKGSGVFLVTGEYFNNEKPILIASSTKQILKDSWTTQSMKFAVKDTKKKGITNMVLYFGGTRKTQFWIKNITVEIGKKEK